MLTETYANEGDVGVGKSSFIDTFISTLSDVQSNQVLEEFIPETATAASPATARNTPAIRLSTVRVRTGPILHQDDGSPASQSDDSLGLLPPKIDIPAREVSFVTLPGYSSTTNPSQILSMTDNYLSQHLHKATNIFSSTIAPSQLAWFLIAGSGAHSLPTCAFYFVLYELKPIDILYMKLIHERVNLVPILTKADTLSQKELWVLKKRMIRQLKLNGIHFHTFGYDLDTVEKMVGQRQWGGSPFVISTRRDQEGRLFESELHSLVKICLYERFRHSQEDAARKVISWRAAFGPTGNPAMSTAEKIWGERSTTSTSIRPAELSPKAQKPMDTQLVPPLISCLDNGFTPPPPQHQVEALASPSPGEVVYAPPPPSATPNPSSPYPTTPGGYVSPPSLPTFAATGAGHAGVTSSSSSAYSPGSNYVPTTAYSPPPRSASEARLSLIHQSTGMIVDPSTRPNEIMDVNSMNTVHTQAQGSFVGSYVAPPVENADKGPVTPRPDAESYVEGSEVKVEVLNSVVSYQPTPSSDAASVDFSLQQKLLEQQQQQQQQQQKHQQQPSFILSGGYATPGTYLISQSDLYPGPTLSTATCGTPAAIGEYGEILPDIWEAAELGDLATVQRHLSNGASPDQRNTSRSTLLHRTAWQGSKPYAVMHLLISYGANVNLTNENGNTVLQNVLMKHDDPALIKLLLENGAETVIPNKEGMNTLEVAALFNKIESVKYLLENDLASSEPDSILAALHRARSPDKKAMRALLKSWHGKDGEKRRMDLMERLQITGQQQGQQHRQAHNRSLSQLHNPSQSQITDANSVHSFETSKGGDGNASSSKASSLNQEGQELGPSSGTPSVSSSQAKHMSRFNLKTMRAAAPSMGNLFNRK
ncbi:hypothetical protein BGX28_003502 [Mortierella sp. GBA30]|nr:hypothetical protein BGX28_003502 [Mortierella sp. GBA30]